MYERFVSTYFLTLNLELTGIIIWLDVFQFWSDHARNFKSNKSEISGVITPSAFPYWKLESQRVLFLRFGLNVFNIISHDIKGQYKVKAEHERVKC